ncbi:hypothetical protein M885DRAFT_569378 [Pelagophyceae sp. CCMP2097]|nr:hypothetical protein M885DRAFT_569378 [Pelagophyceae sp. CCMP2097]
MEVVVARRTAAREATTPNELEELIGEYANELSHEAARGRGRTRAEELPRRSTEELEQITDSLIDATTPERAATIDVGSVSTRRTAEPPSAGLVYRPRAFQGFDEDSGSWDAEAMCVDHRFRTAVGGGGLAETETLRGAADAAWLALSDAGPILSQYKPSGDDAWMRHLTEKSIRKRILAHVAGGGHVRHVEFNKVDEDTYVVRAKVMPSFPKKRPKKGPLKEKMPAAAAADDAAEADQEDAAHADDLECEATVEVVDKFQKKHKGQKITEYTVVVYINRDNPLPGPEVLCECYVGLGADLANVPEDEFARRFLHTCSHVGCVYAFVQCCFTAHETGVPNWYEALPTPCADHRCPGQAKPEEIASAGLSHIQAAYLPRARAAISLVAAPPERITGILERLNEADWRAPSGLGEPKPRLLEDLMSWSLHWPADDELPPPPIDGGFAATSPRNRATALGSIYEAYEPQPLAREPPKNTKKKAAAGGSAAVAGAAKPTAGTRFSAVERKCFQDRARALYSWDNAPVPRMSRRGNKVEPTYFDNLDAKSLAYFIETRTGAWPGLQSKAELLDLARTCANAPAGERPTEPEGYVAWRQQQAAAQVRGPESDGMGDA